MSKQDAWFLIGLVICITIACCVLMIVTTDWNYTIKFEMDNNTLEAVKSINWSAIWNNGIGCSINETYDNCNSIEVNE